MRIKSESYPDRVRKIASDLVRVRDLYDLDRSIEMLHAIANELELKLKKGPLKKS